MHDSSSFEQCLLHWQHLLTVTESKSSNKQKLQTNMCVKCNSYSVRSLPLLALIRRKVIQKIITNICFWWALWSGRPKTQAVHHQCLLQRANASMFRVIHFHHITPQFGLWPMPHRTVRNSLVMWYYMMCGGSQWHLEILIHSFTLKVHTFLNVWEPC